MIPIVLAAHGAERAAAALAQHLQVPLGRVWFRRFPDGESYLRLPDDVAGRDVIVAASLRDPDPQALGLWYLAETAREFGARSVGLVAPYLPYLQQDKRFQAGEAVTSKIFARFLSQSFDWLVTVDPHLHRLGCLDAIYTVPAFAVSSAPAIARWVAAEVGNPVIVGFEGESEPWASGAAERLGCPIMLLARRRQGLRSVTVAVPDAHAHHGRTPVVVDDIISSGRTMAVAAVQLRAAFGYAPVCIGVHAVFAHDAARRLKDAGASRLVTCNTLPHETNGIDVFGEVATAVRERLDMGPPAASG